MTTSGQCVLGWYPDESVKGATNLKPVVCATVIDALRTIIAKVALGHTLAPEEKDIVEALAMDFLAGAAEEMAELMPGVFSDRHRPARLVALPNPVVAEGSA